MGLAGRVIYQGLFPRSGEVPHHKKGKQVALLAMIFHFHHSTNFGLFWGHYHLKGLLFFFITIFELSVVMQGGADRAIYLFGVRSPKEGGET